MEDQTNPSTENTKKVPETTVPEGGETKEAAPEQATPETVPIATAATQGDEAKKEPPKPEVKQPPVTSDEKIWGLASYLPLVAILALVVNPRSDYIKLHGRQGLLLFIISFFSIFVYIVPFIGYIIGIIVHFGIIAVGLFSMFQAFSGNWWKIPVLGDLAELIPVEMFTKVAREAAIGPKGIEKDEEAKRVEDEKKAEEQAEVAPETQTPEPESPEAKPEESAEVKPEEAPAETAAPEEAVPAETAAPEAEVAETKEAAPSGKQEDAQQELPIEEKAEETETTEASPEQKTEETK